MSEARAFKHIGQRTIRPDGFDKVTGKANYGADLALPGMIWGAILRSPHAHANIRSINTERAEASPDVLAIATFQDFPSVNDAASAAGTLRKDLIDTAQNILAQDKVLYHGHAVAAVAARTEAAAEAALALIDVDYEVLSPVLSIDAAIAEDAPLTSSSVED
jgi:CO/xanthine dehydrogenase Mo-binding subunit